MRICIFTDSFLPFTSGVTFSVLNQATEMARRGHQVWIVCPKPPRQTAIGELPAGIEVIHSPWAFRAPKFPSLRITVPTFLPLYRRMRRIRPDIIHVNTEWGCGWEGLVSAKLLGVPLVGTFHTFFADPAYLRTIGLPSFRWIQRLMWFYSVFFYSRCQAVTSPSAAVKRSLTDRGIRVEPQVVPNGIFSPVEEVDWRRIRLARRQRGILGPAFVFVGRLSHEKSIDVTLRAFQLVVRRRRHCKLVLIGDGPARAELQQLVKQLALEANVIFEGHIAHDRLIEERLPLMADVFVTASKTENQPMSILEAMSMGLPVIGARAKGLPELVEHGVNGLLFEPDDIHDLARCMMRLATRKGRRRLMSVAAAQFAAQYHMPRVIDQLEKLYETVRVASSSVPLAGTRL